MINVKLIFVAIILTILAGCSSKPLLEHDQKFTDKPLSLSTARFGHAVVNDNQKIYVLAGGSKTKLLSDIEIIDPQLKTTKVLKNILIPRRYFSAVWDGQHSIYIIGGVSVQNKQFRYEKRVEVFDTITHQVSFVESHPAPTRSDSAVYLDGYIYVFGGSYPKDKKLTPSAIVTVFDISNNKWLRAADMPTAKETRAVTKDGLIYVVGGFNTRSALDVFERFDPKTNMWQSLPAMPEKISAHSLSLVNDKLYLFGDYKNLTSTYSYNFTTQTWKKTDIGYQASRHNGATTLGDTTYVIGGNTTANGPFLNTIQKFKLK